MVGLRFGGWGNLTYQRSFRSAVCWLRKKQAAMELLNPMMDRMVKIAVTTVKLFEIFHLSAASISLRVFFLRFTLDDHLDTANTTPLKTRFMPAIPENTTHGWSMILADCCTRSSGWLGFCFAASKADMLFTIRTSESIIMIMATTRM